MSESFEKLLRQATVDGLLVGEFWTCDYASVRVTTYRGPGNRPWVRVMGVLIDRNGREVEKGRILMPATCLETLRELLESAKKPAGLTIESKSKGDFHE